MDIYQPLRGCLCVMPVWCWLVGRVGACLCGCYGAMCVWVDWRLALHVCGASWRDGAMRVPLARSLLGACVPTTVAALLSRGLWIYQPSGAALCDASLVLVGGGEVCLCGCCLVVRLCSWFVVRLLVLFVGALRVPLARSLLGACVPTTGTVVPQSWVIYQPLWGCRCVCQSGGRGRYRLGEIEVFGISFVLLLLQN